ncbi:type II CAAX endopeptidase family protein [Porphyromonas pogonae]|uniref:CPBP family intramembrane glutamic endopeptidase n=1 Tax=Porphyromonas pogonae TaxID=867595 RepID=UPI002E7A5D45|nr:type II CAAX endopeptidase family protein [Porphyromonas pogonae]
MKNNLDITKAAILGVVYIILLGSQTSQMFILSLLPIQLAQGFIANVIIYTLPIVLAVVFYGKEVFYNFSYFKEKPAKKIGFLFLAFALAILGNALTSLLQGDNDLSFNQQGFNQVSNEVPIIFPLLLLGILGPYVEEIIFRHIMIGKLSRYIPVIVLAPISLILFDLIHVHVFMDFLSYLPLAIILTGAYILSGKNISFTLTLHCFNNILTVLVAVLS